MFPELEADRPSGAAVALGEDTVARAVLQVAAPDDDEIAGPVRGDGRDALPVRRESVDPELGAERHTGAGVALAVDTPVRAVLLVALPDHDEVAGGIGGD
jgi:hypothetical protein